MLPLSGITLVEVLELPSLLRQLKNEWFYQCQNCNARVGCHRGTTRPLGNVANEVLGRCQ